MYSYVYVIINPLQMWYYSQEFNAHVAHMAYLIWLYYLIIYTYAHLKHDPKHALKYVTKWIYVPLH